MIYNLLQLFPINSFTLEILEYIPFRASCAVITALILSLILGPRFIRFLKFLQGQGQPIRKEGPQGHLFSKKGIPTMGGGLILLTTLISYLICAREINSYTVTVIIIAVSFGTLGAVDDYLKLSDNNLSNGLSIRNKLICQFSIAIIGALIFFSHEESSTSLFINLLGDLIPSSKLLSIFIIAIFLVGFSNAVNLSDGLDGLAIGLVIIVSACLSLIAYLVEPCINGSSELSIFCCSMVGSGLGFLWFNTLPAKIFMGDTGSLSIGGILGTIGIITKYELVLLIIGGLFIIEAVSVIVQIVSFKITRRRFFLMAPIHHHFEENGIEESVIVVRFWIIGCILAVAGLSMISLDWCSFYRINS